MKLSSQLVWEKLNSVSPPPPPFMETSGGTYECNKLGFWTTFCLNQMIAEQRGERDGSMYGDFAVYPRAIVSLRDFGITWFRVMKINRLNFRSNISRCLYSFNILEMQIFLQLLCVIDKENKEFPTNQPTSQYPLVRRHCCSKDGRQDW